MKIELSQHSPLCDLPCPHPTQAKLSVFPTHTAQSIDLFLLLYKCFGVVEEVELDPG